MELLPATRVFGALAHPTRLAVFRQLAQAGDRGVCAGVLAERCALAPSTLSFHLRDLQSAGLVTARRAGREIHYAVHGSTLREALWFLGEDCCQGRADLCPAPTERITAQRGAGDDARPGVLFVCSHNAARSQLAEALLRHRAGDRFTVHSAGVRPSQVHPLVATVLAEIDVPSDGLHSKDLGSLLGKHGFHHAIVLCPEAQADCPARVPFALHHEFWPFADPTATPGPRRRQMDAFRATRDAIAARLDAWLATQPQPRATKKPPRPHTA